MEKSRDIFVAVLEDHKALIYKVVNSYCKSEEDRQDLVQEIVIQLWSSFGNYDDRYKYTTWIYRIALNTSISFYRKYKARQEKNVEFPAILENTLTPAETQTESQELILLRKFLTELKEIDTALMLMYLDGLSYREISEVMGISPSNVTTKISRIKNQLRQKFEQIKN